jgi:methyltransferase family protein
MLCKICAQAAGELATAKVLGKHDVRYFHCPNCGFVQTEEPYWLAESYSDAIGKTDIGLVGRNLGAFDTTKPLVQAFFNENGKFLDYGGGYGMFVRMMRDAGFDYYLYDQYCENLFAKGFAANGPDGGPYELVTAFEVFEHLVDPITEIDRMRQFSDSIFFSTIVIASPPPKPGEWWYYALEHGQHVALYSKRSLEVVAERLGCRLYSNGQNLHLLTPKNIAGWKFRAILNPRVRRFAKHWLNRRMRGRSLLASDYEKIAGRPLA